MMEETPIEPIPFKMPEGSDIATPEAEKKTPAQLLQESEYRNMGLVEYVLLLEKICKSCLFRAAREHESLSLIIAPHTEKTMDVLAQICIATAPVCGDVEEMKAGGVTEKIMEMLTEREDEDDNS